jgi:hypothetical protein
MVGLSVEYTMVGLSVEYTMVSLSVEYTMVGLSVEYTMVSLSVEYTMVGLSVNNLTTYQLNKMRNWGSENLYFFFLKIPVIYHCKVLLKFLIFYL